MVNPRVIRSAVKYGPVIAGAARKYGPALAQEARKHAPAVIEEVERRTGRRAGQDAAMADATPRQSGGLLDNTPLGQAAAKRRAAAHARTVVDGSMLQTFLRSRPVWVVFSGDTPVATHPHVEAPFSELLRHADLSARVVPRGAGSAPGPRSAGDTAGAGTTAGAPAPGAAGSSRADGGQRYEPGDDEPLTGTVHTP